MADIHSILKEYYAYDKFRALQEEIITSVLDKKDTLAILPTGGGKSICFQIPALAQEGLCIVISPLIALMKDQVYQLRQRNIPADAIYSGMSYRTIDRILENATYGKTKLLYISPERLKTELFLERIKNMKISMIAVDEAHCISEWGHDFRPAYREIAEVRSMLIDVPLIALTASARPVVQKDISENLLFRYGATHFQKSFKRENIAYAVVQQSDKLNRLVKILQHVSGSALVYVRSRKSTRDISDLLVHHQVQSDYYHAGLSSAERERKQEAWIRGKVRVMVCTNAFGMGIDKSDVRCVVHLDIAESMEAYYQEAGRAGRDGKKSYAIILTNAQEKTYFMKKIQSLRPSPEYQKKVYTALCNYARLAEGSGEGLSIEFSWQEFLMRYDMRAIRTHAAMKALEDNGLIHLNDGFKRPGSVQFLSSPNELYEYQLKHRRHDILIKILSRSFEGIFDFPVEIDELQLMRQLKWSKKELNAAFKSMVSLGHVRYTASSDVPLLTFLTGRLPISHISLDTKKQQELYEIKLTQAKAMLSYVNEKEICRSVNILDYFGEKDGSLCGICDVCAGRFQVNKEMLLLRKELKSYIEKNPSDKITLEDNFKSDSKESMHEALRWLLDHGHIIKDEEERFKTVD